MLGIKKFIGEIKINGSAWITLSFMEVRRPLFAHDIVDLCELSRTLEWATVSPLLSWLCLKPISPASKVTYIRLRREKKVSWLAIEY